jgi:hypothetical protein
MDFLFESSRDSSQRQHPAQPNTAELSAHYTLSTSRDSSQQRRSAQPHTAELAAHFPHKPGLSALDKSGQ